MTISMALTSFGTYAAGNYTPPGLVVASCTSSSASAAPGTGVARFVMASCTNFGSGSSTACLGTSTLKLLSNTVTGALGADPCFTYCANGGFGSVGLTGLGAVFTPAAPFNATIGGSGGCRCPPLLATGDASSGLTGTFATAALGTSVVSFSMGGLSALSSTVSYVMTLGGTSIGSVTYAVRLWGALADGELLHTPHPTNHTPPREEALVRPLCLLSPAPPPSPSPPRCRSPHAPAA